LSTEPWRLFGGFFLGLKCFEHHWSDASSLLARYRKLLSEKADEGLIAGSIKVAVDRRLHDAALQQTLFIDSTVQQKGQARIRTTAGFGYQVQQTVRSFRGSTHRAESNLCQGRRWL
jgi:hypothetical protein